MFDDVEVFDKAGNAVYVPWSTYEDWRYSVMDGNTYRSLIDFYREEHEG